MQISLKYGYVFLSAPKCASTSIESVLSDYSDGGFSGHPAIKHINALRYKKNIEPIFAKKIPLKKKNNIEIVCVMREPLEWLHSWYRYRARSELSSPKHPQHKNYTGNITFNEFIKNYLKEEKPSFARVGQQSTFMEDRQGELIVDRIFRLDSLHEAEIFFSKKIGKDISFPQANTSKKKKLEIDNSLKDELVQLLERDYRYYNKVAV